MAAIPIAHGKCLIGIADGYRGFKKFFKRYAHADKEADQAMVDLGKIGDHLKTPLLILR
jgi:hypothetical protein